MIFVVIRPNMRHRKKPNRTRWLSCSSDERGDSNHPNADPVNIINGAHCRVKLNVSTILNRFAALTLSIHAGICTANNAMKTFTMNNVSVLTSPNNHRPPKFTYAGFAQNCGPYTADNSIHATAMRMPSVGPLKKPRYNVPV